ncbi:MAG: DsbA family oxidoreductase [Alphaproteobacteria bacterium]|nr:DsbA family oxidoreductase [Alphaproteobacteria bacterium]
MIQIDLFSDVVCPWCFIGKRRLEQAIAARPEQHVVIRWRTFQLNPDMPRDGMLRQHYVEAKFGGPERADQIYSSIRDAGEAVGLPFAFEKIERVPNTVTAHRLIYWSTTQEKADPVVENLFRAYFFEGRDIGSIDVLSKIATESGLDGDTAKEFLRSEHGRAEVAAESRYAYENGITGVPCFIFNRRYAIAGAQEPEAFFPLFDLEPEDITDAAD